MYLIVLLLFNFFAQVDVVDEPINSSISPCDSLNYVTDSLFENYDSNVEKNLGITTQLLIEIKKAQCENYPVLLNKKGLKAYENGDPLASKKVLLEAEKILKSSSLPPIHLINNQIYLGLTNILDHNHETAILYFSKVVSLSKEVNDQNALCSGYQNLALIYLNSDDLPNAEYYLKKAKEIIEIIGDREAEGYVLQNLAQLYDKKGDFNVAMDFANQAEALWISLHHLKGLYYVNIIKSQIYKKMDRTNQQIEFIRKGLQYSDSINININKGLAYVEMAKAYDILGEEEQAKESYELALKYGVTLEKREVSLAISRLLDIYSSKSELDKLKSLITELLVISNSVQTLKEIEAKKWVKSEGDLEQKLDENEKLTLAKELSEEKFKGQRRISSLFVAMFLMMLFFTYLLIKRNKEKQRLIAKIEQQNKKLSISNTSLEDSSQIIAQQNSQLKMKNEQLKNFAYVASHDLKSPLRTINSFTGLIKKQLDPNKDKELTELLEYVEGAAIGLGDLITDLLSFAKLENDALKRSTFDPNVLIQGVLADLQTDIQEKEVELIVGEIPKSIEGDPLKLKRVFQNLISNAVKFTDSSRSSRISISSARSKKETTFHIADNGIGIAEEYQDKIFEMFRKLHAETEFKGTGMGLAICSRIIEMHGGTIQVQSKVGEGSTFSFTIANQPFLLMEDPAVLKAK